MDTIITHLDGLLVDVFLLQVVWNMLPLTSIDSLVMDDWATDNSFIFVESSDVDDLN